VDWASLLTGLVTPENAVLMAVLAWVLLREKTVRDDRTHYQEERTAWTSERAGIKQGHDEECAKAKAENQELEDKLDAERARRREIEDRLPPSWTTQIPPLIPSRYQHLERVDRDPPTDPMPQLPPGPP
jgi:hypothetical protein